MSRQLDVANVEEAATIVQLRAAAVVASVQVKDFPSKGHPHDAQRKAEALVSALKVYTALANPPVPSYGGWGDK